MKQAKIYFFALSVAYAILLVLGNLVFLLMDKALARLSVLWRQRLRQRFFH